MRIERQLSHALVVGHPERAARLLEQIVPAEAVAALEQFDAEAAAGVLRSMEPATASTCLAAWSEERLGGLFEAFPPGEAAQLVSRLEVEDRARILARVPREIADPLERLLERPEGTAGALMDPRPPTLPADVSVAEARRLIRRQSRDLLYYVYVVDREQRLAGVVNLKRLLAARPKDALVAAMQTPVKRLMADTDWESVVAHPGWRELHALPVVDERGVLVGVLRYETLRRLELNAGRHRTPGLLAVGLAFGEVYCEIATRLLEETLDLVGALAPVSEEGHRRS